MMFAPHFRKTLIVLLSVGAVSACVKTVENDLNTVRRELPNRGTTTEIAVPPQDAAAVTIAALASKSFPVSAAENVDDKTRIMVSSGPGLSSWGEVGRVDLRPKSASTTTMYAVVERLVAIVGDPSVEGDFITGWKAAIDERSATLAAKRKAGAYAAYTVKARRRGKSFSASSGGGAGLGFLAGGIAGAAIGGSAEARRGQRTPYEYDLQSNGRTETIESFVPYEVGACVGIADDDMEPTSSAKIAEAKRKAEEQSDGEDAPPYDPANGIVVLAPLASEAC